MKKNHEREGSMDRPFGRPGIRGYGWYVGQVFQSGEPRKKLKKKLKKKTETIDK